MQYTKILFDNIDKETSDALQGLLSGIDEITGTEILSTALVAYCDAATFPGEALDAITTQLRISYTTSVIREENWNAAWEEDFKPISIDDFCHIRAGFHPPPAASFRHEILITPKMSFGTGHHETTQLVIRQMQHLDFKGKTVFDFGTGTGILAILAEQLGAQQITAIDNDKWSIENSIENINGNGCGHITVTADDITTVAGTNASFNIILANINRQILLQYMPQLNDLLQPGGYMLISGFLEADIPLLQAAVQGQELREVNLLSANNWVCMLLRK